MMTTFNPKHRYK